MQGIEMQRQTGLKRKRADDTQDSDANQYSGQTGFATPFRGGAAYKKRLLQQYLEEQRQKEQQKKQQLAPEVEEMMPATEELPAPLQGAVVVPAQVDVTAPHSSQVDSMLLAADPSASPASPATPTMTNPINAQLDSPAAFEPAPAGTTVAAPEAAAAAATAATAAATTTATSSPWRALSPARRRQLWADMYRQEKAAVGTNAQQQPQPAADAAATPEPAAEPAAAPVAVPAAPVAPPTAPAAVNAATPASSEDGSSLLVIEVVESPGPEAEYSDAQLLQELLDTCCSRLMPRPIMEVALYF